MLTVVLFFGSYSLFAQSFTENFDDITTLPGDGWFQQNNSSPIGTTSWFQGPGFPAFNGAANSYIAANFNNAAGTGTISNWLLTPVRTLQNGDVLTFRTRVFDNPTSFPDRLEVRLSTNGTSSNVGTLATDVGDFTTLLLSVNPSLTTTGYPNTWTLFTATVTGLSGPTSGRFAFRYFVTSGGPTGANSDFIGIDNVVYVPFFACPAITLNPAALPDATATVAYSQNITQTGGTDPTTYAVTGGALPAGLTLTAGGILSGTTTATGTFNFQITATDANLCTGVQNYTLNVLCPANPSVVPYTICQNGTVPAGQGLQASGCSSGFSAVSNFTGTTVGGPTFNRGVQQNTQGGAFTLSGVGTNVAYTTFTFQVSVSGTYIFNTCGTAPVNWDAFDHFYINSFDPASPATNFIYADDDGGTGCSAGPRSTVTLVAGQTYVYVVTGFGNADAGAFITTFSGPGSILLLSPNPTQWFTAATGGSPIATGSVFNPVGAAGSGIANTATAGEFTFYAACGDLPDCRVPVVFTIDSAPVALCKDTFVYLDANGEASITVDFVDNGSYAKCGLQSISVSPSDFTCSNLGGNVVTLTIIDNEGNSANCNATVTVIDSIAPVVVCPSDVTVSNDAGICGAVVDFGVTVQDSIVQPSNAFENGLASNDAFPLEVADDFTLTSCVDITSFSANFFNNTPASDVTVTIYNDNAGEPGTVFYTTIIPSGSFTQNVVGTSLGFDMRNYVLPLPSPLNVCAGTYWLSLVGSGVAPGDFYWESTSASGFGDNAKAIGPLTSGVWVNANTLIVQGNQSFTLNYTQQLPAFATDNCGTPTITQIAGLPSGSTFPVGTTLNTFVAEDASGNTDTCSFTVTVTDTTKPILALENCVGGSFEIQIDGVGIDNFIDEIEWELLDASNTVVASGDYPSFSQGSATASVAGTNGPYTFNITAFGPFNDNIGSFTISSSGAVVASGAAVGTFYGGSGTASVSGFCPLQPGCLSDIVVPITAGTCEATVTYPQLFVGDNCPSATVTQIAGLPSGSAFPAGVTVNTFVAADASGNTDTCSFTVTVQDTSAAQITCPADITVSNDAGICGAVVGFNAPSASTVCGASCATYVSNSAANIAGLNYLGAFNGHHYVVATNQLNWNAANASAIALGGQLAVINDATENAFLASVLLNDAWIGGFQNALNPLYSEPAGGWEWVDGSPFSYTNWAFGEPNQGGIGIEDHIQFIAGIGEWNDNNEAALFDYVIEFTCPVLAFQSDGPDSGSVFPVGTTQVEFTALSAFGSSDVCTFDVTVQDTSKPVIACPADIAVSNEVGTCGAVVTFADPTATDNCASADSATFPLTIFPHGAGAINTTDNNLFGGYFFDLTNNNSQSIEVTGFQVRFGDFAFGVVPSPQTVEAYFTTTASTYVGNNTNSGAWTSAGSASVAVAGVNGEFSQFTLPSSFTLAAGATKGIYIFAPNAGLLYNGSGSSSFTPITVGDLTLIPGLSSASLFDNSGFTPRIPNVQVQYSIPSLSSTVTQIQGLPSGSTFPVGVTTNTFVATDAAGNADTCSFTVTVADTSLPVAVCQDVTVYLVGGTATITGADVNNGSTDNCGIETLSVSPNTFTCAELGANNVTLTVTDTAGNIATCTAVVTVLDTTSPNAVCQDVTIYLDAAGNATLSASQVDNGSTVGCGSSSITVSPNTFDCSNIGANTVTLTVTDASSNVSTCQATVTVLDTVRPALSCPADITAFSSASGCGAAVTYPAPSATDNCASGTNNTITVNQTGLPVAIPDNNPTGVTNTLNVTAFGAGEVLGGNVTLNSVCFRVNHTWVGDVSVSLRAPDGTIVPLLARPGVPNSTFGCSSDNIDMCVELGVGADAELVCNPNPLAISGTFKAHAGADLNLINTNGGLANGGWDLIVTDAAAGDLGTIQAWSLNFTQTIGGVVTINQIAGLPSGATFPRGVTTNTFVATDPNGNTDTCTFTVTVSDTTRPVAICQNVTVTLDGSGNASVTAAQINNGSTDNCGIQTISVSPNTFTCANIGANTVTLTVSDSAGNSNTCNATVTVASYSATLTGLPLSANLLLNENFDVFPPANWVFQNNSAPVGTTPLWFQGNPAVFPAFNGATNSYAAANFNNVAGNNTISNWMITPVVSMKNGDVLTFRTRTVTAPAFADRLEVRQSTNGASTDVGTSNTSVGDFTNLLLTINPTLTPTGYPNQWTQFTVTVSGLSGPTTGRFAFRYFVTSGGPTGANSDYIGVDNVTYSTFEGTICEGETANLQVNISAGGGGYAVTYTDGSNNFTVNPYNSGDNIPVSPSVSTTYSLVSVTDASSCSASSLSGTYNLNVNPAPTVNITADQQVCNGELTTPVAFSGTGDVFDWTNSEPSIGLAASGVGNIAAFTAVNLGATTVVAEVIVTPENSVTGCVGTPDTFSITVFPTPDVAATADQVVCNNENTAAIIFSGAVAGTTFDWVNDDPSIGLAASGTGDILSFVATNTGNLPVTATIIVTPTANGCPGESDTFTITVNPGPVAVCQDATVYLDGTGNATLDASAVNNGSTASCGILSITVAPNTFDCSDAGTTVQVTLTVTDSAGNVATCTADVAIADTIAPVVVCPSDITVSNDPGVCGATVTYPTATFSDNCAGIVSNNVTLTQTGLPAAIPDNSPTGVTNTLNVNTFGAGDVLGGNVTLNNVCFEIQHTWVGDLIVSLQAPDGTIVPLLNRPGTPPGTFGCANNHINACVELGVGADMEGVCNTSTTPTPPPYAISGTFKAHAGADLNAINLAAGLANGSWRLIVSDNAGGDLGSILAWSLNFTQTSISGGGVTQIAGLPSGAVFPVGSTVNTFVADDGNGNTDTCSFTVTVNDTEAPTFGLQSCVGGSFNINLSAQFLDETSWTFTDATNTVLASGGPYPFGVTTVNVPVAGTNGPYTFNIETQGFFGDNDVNYVVSCSGSPVATGLILGGNTLAVNDICCLDGPCPQDIVVAADPGACDATVNYTAPIAVDNCGTVTQSLTAGLPSGSVFPSGTTTVTYTAEDAAGNTSLCTFTVTVLETTPPTAICKDITVYLDATGNVTISPSDVDNGSFDNCGIDSLSLDRRVFSCRDVGVNTVVLFVTDLSGNIDACQATVTVLDTIAFQIICPADITVSNGIDSCGAVVFFDTPDTYDNCGDTSRLTHSLFNDILPGNSVACASILGHTDNSYFRVYDLNQFGYPVGNDFSVTSIEFGIEEADAPSGSQQVVLNLYTLSGPLNFANLTLVATQNVTIPNQTGTVVNVPLTATIPGGSTLVVELFTPNGQALGNFFFIGSNSFGQTDLSYIAAPACGINQPSDFGSVGFPSTEIILNVLSVPTVTVTQIAGLPSGSVFPVGTTVNTFVADNGAGSLDTCSFTVTVIDTAAPVAVCQDITVYLDATGNVSITPADVDNGSTDNCGIETYALSQSSFDCSEIGPNSVTLTVTDTAGNASSCTATVTVLDTIAPIAVCQDATVYLDASGNLVLTGAEVDGGSTDNCAIVNIVITPNTFTCADIGITVPVSATFFDASGNFATCQADVTIADTVAPVAQCQNLTIQLDINGTATITPAQIDNGSTDACGIESITLSQTDFDCSNIGDNVVTLFVTDSSGNVGTCTAVVTVEPSATIDSFTLSNYNGFNVSCFGSSDGSATVHVSSPFPVTYEWSNGATTATISNLTAGTYIVTVTAGTCEFIDSVTLTEPDSLEIATVLSDYNGFGVRCFGSNDGTIRLNVSGGVPAYSYAWPTSAAIGNTNVANALLPGVYSITVTDLNGCTAVAEPELTQPTQVQTSIVGSSPNCNGGNDGRAFVTTSGGVGNYTYLWSTVPAQTTDTASGLTAGTYTVTVTDGNGCTSVNSVTIVQPAQLIAIAQTTTNFNGFNVSCFGGSNGAGSVNVIGGTAPFSYTWSGGTASGNAVSGLAAGTYRVTVTDANGCTALDSITVTQPPRLIAAASVISNYNGAQISCNGSADGLLSATATGGVGPYFYNWNTTPPQSTQVATGVGAGTYIVTVTDINGCTDTASITITQPAAITASGAVTSNFNGFGVSCFGGSNGAATITATGGTGTLNYTWPAGSGVGNTANATGLTAGTYVVTVTDTNSCSATVSITVTQPTQLSAATTAEDAKCFGSTDGRAWVTVTGGVPTYTYSWNTTPVQSTDTATNLGAGTYTVAITDQNGCSATATVTVGQPALLVATIVGDDVTCPGGSDGSATASATGGTSPYNYVWSTTPAQTGATATGLTAGTYTVTVTDANNCTATQAVTIGVKFPVLPTATISGGGAVCEDDPRPDVVITFTGNPPYSFTLNRGQVTTNYTGVTNSPFVIANAGAGTYTITNFSDVNCAGTASGSAVVTVNPIPSVLVSGGGFVCDGEELPSVEIEFTGTGPWSVVIRLPEGKDTLIENANTSPLVFNPSTEGFYVVRSVADANGCVAFNLGATKEVGFYLLPLVDAGADKTVAFGESTVLDGRVVTAYGGFVTYAWTPDDSTLNNPAIEKPTARPLETTTYELKATDRNGCSASDSVTVFVTDKIFVDVINVFTPDGDGINEFFVIRNRDAFDVVELTIVNRWGHILFESDNYFNNWDGTWKGKPVDDGTYYYVIRLPNDGNKIVKGAVTILRNDQ